MTIKLIQITAHRGKNHRSIPFSLSVQTAEEVKCHIHLLISYTCFILSVISAEDSPQTRCK